MGRLKEVEHEVEEVVVHTNEAVVHAKEEVVHEIKEVFDHTKKVMHMERPAVADPNTRPRIIFGPFTWE